MIIANIINQSFKPHSLQEYTATTKQLNNNKILVVFCQKVIFCPFIPFSISSYNCFHYLYLIVLGGGEVSRGEAITQEKELNFD